jgi:hypothetical protein
MAGSVAVTAPPMSPDADGRLTSQDPDHPTVRTR